MLDIDAIFSIPRRRKQRPIVAVWPCGTRWTIEGERGHWEAPIYRNGQQSSMTILADTRAELLDELRAEGARIER